MPGSVAQLDACSTGDQEIASPVQHHSFVEIDPEIFSTVILSLLLIQEGKLSVTCKRMCTEYCRHIINAIPGSMKYLSNNNLSFGHYHGLETAREPGPGLPG